MCAQLGSGLGSHYPHQIDTRQVFQNTASPAPDSDTRLDAEVQNDALHAIVSIEEALGAGITGSYGSLAARLDAMEVGVPSTPPSNVVEFAGETGVLMPGSGHSQGQQALLYAVYDGGVPRQLVAPGSFVVYSVSFNVVASFEVPQSGVLMVAALTPQYVTTFVTPVSPPYTVTIAGATHGLTGPYFFYQAYGTGDPRPTIEVGSFSVNTSTFTVTMEFGAPQSGTLLLATGAPRFVQAFTNVSAAAPLTITGATHGLGTANLLAQVYTASGADVFAMPVGALTVHHATFDVTLTFAVPQSGTLILAPVPSVAPPALRAQAEALQPLRAQVRTTRGVQDAQRLVAMQDSLSAVMVRLAALETHYQALLAQLSSPTDQEETPP